MRTLNDISCLTHILCFCQYECSLKFEYAYRLKVLFSEFEEEVFEIENN